MVNTFFVISAYLIYFVFIIVDELSGTANCTDSSPITISIEAYQSAIILGAVRFVATVVMSRLLQSIPRRILYLSSATATTISLIGVATFSCVVVSQKRNLSL